MLRERIGSFTIIFHGKILRMLCAVQFDDKLMRWTSEINDITKDWQLPAETQASSRWARSAFHKANSASVMVLRILRA